MAGYIEWIKGKFEADHAQNQVRIAEAKAKQKSLQNLSGLIDMLAQYQQQESWANKGAYQLSPGSEDPNVINPEVQPVAQPSGQNLLAQFMKTYPESAGTILSKANDPDTQLKNRIAGMISPQSGATPQTGGMGNIAEIIKKAQAGDPEAVAMGAALKMGGLDIFPGIQAANSGKRFDIQQKQYELAKAKGMEQTAKDPTGAEYIRYIDPLTRTPIMGPDSGPGGWELRTATPMVRLEGKTAAGAPQSSFVQPSVGSAFVTGPPELRTVTEQLPGGGETTRGIPTTQPFAITTKQPSGELPIPADDLSLWVSPADLSTAQQGMTPEQAKRAGMQRISTAAKASIDSLKAAKVVVTEIKDLMGKVFPQKESFASPQRLLRPIGASLQTDPDAARLFSLVNGTLAPIIRSLGEKGNLSDTDVKRAQGMAIKGTDSADVAWKKTNGMLELLAKIQRSTFSGGGASAGRPKAKTAADLLNKWGVK